MSKKWWLCEEYGEKFIIQATNLDEATEGALLYGGRVLRELTPEEVAELNNEQE